MNNELDDSKKASLLSIDGLDEMQKSQAYKIAFKCFKNFYWGIVIIAAVLIVIPKYFDDNTTFTHTCSVIAIIIGLFASVIYTIFAAKTSRVGAMPPQFIASISSTKGIIALSVIVLAFIVISVIGFFKSGSERVLYFLVFTLIFYVSHVITYFLAKKSVKLMNEEAEEE